MKSFRFLLLLLLLLLLLPLSSTAVWTQETPHLTTRPAPHRTENRPTIGLVLEGGGALGLAHVGVLRWFEENHIPVDYVAGTSMGALIGSLYATGMSGHEIDKFLKGVDWNAALRNELPYASRSFRRKEDKRDYPNDLEFGLKSGVVFPGGFNSGHQVGLILDRIALPYSQLESFDELPTPFRCVATDLVEGKAIVFDHGSLTEALRATMSLPAIFSPVHRDGHVYVDGGLIENLPVDVARAMGADIVIAVHLETAPLKPEEGLSLFTVMERSVSVVISVNELASMQRADILIPVHTGAYTSTEYQAANKIVEIGYAGAQERGRLLERLALDEPGWAEYQAQREARRRPVPVPQFVEVTGTAPVIAQGIEKNLADVIGKPIDYTSINRRLTGVTGLGRFSRAGFEMIRPGWHGRTARARRRKRLRAAHRQPAVCD